MMSFVATVFIDDEEMFEFKQNALTIAFYAKILS